MSIDLDLEFYIERDGVPVKATLMEWAEYYEKHRFLWRSILGPPVNREVITIFNGHNFLLLRPPKLYSSCVFTQRANWSAPLGGSVREVFYFTRAAAERGHQRLCEALRKGEDIQQVEVSAS